MEMCELITDILADAGFKVDAVHNGYQLLTYLETNNPSVIILDLMMPEKDGISIFDTVKQVSPYARVIIYTGHQEYQHSVYARSADRFVVKGQSIKELINAVEELA